MTLPSLLQRLALPTPALSAQEYDRLIVWKRRHDLEAQGFTTQEARRLLFLQWLLAAGRVGR